MRLQRFGDIQAVYVKRERADHLIVLLHGWMKAPESFEQLLQDIRAKFPQSDVWIPKLPLRYASVVDLDSLAERLVEAISNCIALAGPGEAYRKITLVGHSCGGILARDVYLTAYGVRLGLGQVEVPDAPATKWVEKVDRVVLLAAVNRGWTISSAMSPWLRFVLPLGMAFGHLLDAIPNRTPVIFQIRRGSVHLTNLRLKSLALERKHPDHVPPVIQLIGTVDDIVAPEDNIDLVTGGRFIYLEAAHSGHFNVIHTRDARFGRARAELLCAAMGAPIDALEKHAARRVVGTQRSTGDLDATLIGHHAGPQTQGERPLVCFIVHGIRDNGHWTQKVAQRVLDRAADDGRTVYIYTPSYGFFPLIAFALPWGRQSKVEWFLDLYVEVVSRHPGAEMAYVGHSNGTYLLARGLQLCPSMRIDRVLFAGSVVSRSYDWRRRMNKQVGRVINLVASGDWVVALFPGAFERVRLQDLGSAGHDGFRELPPEDNCRYVPGAHDAGIREEMWSDIAGFVVKGETPMSQKMTVDGALKLARERSWVVNLMGELSPLSWLLIVAIIIAGTWLVLFKLPLPSWGIAIVFAVYAGLVKRLLTKF